MKMVDFEHPIQTIHVEPICRFFESFLFAWKQSETVDLSTFNASKCIWAEFSSNNACIRYFRAFLVDLVLCLLKLSPLYHQNYSHVLTIMAQIRKFLGESVSFGNRDGDFSGCGIPHPKGGVELVSIHTNILSLLAARHLS